MDSESLNNPVTLKEQGNQCFKDGKFADALSFYMKALKLEPKEVDKAVLYKNQAACFLKLEKYSESAIAATKCEYNTCAYLYSKLYVENFIFFFFFFLNLFY